MRTFGFTTLFLLMMVTINAQSFEGSYSQFYKTAQGILEYQLEIRPDQSFRFDFYRKHTCENCEEEKAYATGSWKTINDLVLFYDTTNYNEVPGLSMNFEGSEARIIQKISGHLHIKSKIPILKFIASETFWIKGMELKIGR